MSNIQRFGRRLVSVCSTECVFTNIYNIDIIRLEIKIWHTLMKTPKSNLEIYHRRQSFKGNRMSLDFALL